MNENDIKINVKAEFINLDKIKKQIEDLKNELNNIEIGFKFDEGNEKKFKTRDELVKVYENAELDYEMLDDYIAEIIEGLENIAKIGGYFIDIDLNSCTQKESNYIIDKMSELGYCIDDYKCKTRFSLF